METEGSKTGEINIYEDEDEGTPGAKEGSGSEDEAEIGGLQGTSRLADGEGEGVRDEAPSSGEASRGEDQDSMSDCSSSRSSYPSSSSSDEEDNHEDEVPHDLEGSSIFSSETVDHRTGDLGNRSDNDDPAASRVYQSIEPSPRHQLSRGHSYDRSFSRTTAIHLDEHVDPHISDEDEGAQTGYDPIVEEIDGDNDEPAENQEEWLESRKVSGVSTLPEELDYYRSPLPGRSPLSFSRSHNPNVESRQASVIRQGFVSSPSREAVFAASSPLPGVDRPLSMSHKYQADQYQLSSPPYSRTASGRPVFRNPSSVRAMQMSSPPPFAPSPLSARHARHGSQLNQSISADRDASHSPFPSPKRSRTGTSACSENATPSRQHPDPRKEYPLILLHCTLSPLPSNIPHDQTVLEEAHCPERIRKAAALLSDKLTSTVLDRGILIQHPGEDYELLEERVLESLELKRPRVGACGHFRSASGESSATATDKATLDGNETIGEAQVKCVDCRRHTHPELWDEKTQSETRIWEVKVYAANGLMRAGAWGAAWREMEKVDVEVGIWMSAQTRRRVEEITAAKAQEEVQALSGSEAPSSGARATSLLAELDGSHRIAGHRDPVNLLSQPCLNKPASTAACSRPEPSSSRQYRHRRGRPDLDRGRDGASHGSQTGDFAHEDQPKSRPRRDGNKRRVSNPTGLDRRLPLSILFMNYLSSRKEMLAACLIGLVGLLYMTVWTDRDAGPPSNVNIPPLRDLSQSVPLPTIASLGEAGEKLQAKSEQTTCQMPTVDEVVRSLQLEACLTPPGEDMESKITVPKSIGERVLRELAKEQGALEGLNAGSSESVTERDQKPEAALPIEDVTDGVAAAEVTEATIEYSD